MNCGSSLSRAVPAVSVLDDIALDRPIVGLSRDLAAGFENASHHHNCGQIIFTGTGTLGVVTGLGLRVVPPQRAVWMPPGQSHVLRASVKCELRTLYVDAKAIPCLPPVPHVFFVTPLLREATLELVRLCEADVQPHKYALLCDLVVDEVLDSQRQPEHIHLPLPTDPRVEPIVRRVLDDPRDSRSRDEWGRDVGASGRTIDRIFKSETGLSFGAWKRHALLLEGLRMLSENASVTRVALDLGYSDASSFNKMFKQALGVTPTQFYG